jgi:hypothetical protein
MLGRGRADALCGVTWRERESDRGGSEEAGQDGEVHLAVVVVGVE